MGGRSGPDGDDPLVANRRWWNRAVPVHVASDFYDVDGWLADRRGPRAREAAVVDLLTLSPERGRGRAASPITPS